MQASSPTLHLVYGGTFDPPHLGHLAIARAARDALKVPVWLMPAADPPHRAVPGASATQRAEMLSLAISGESGLFVDLRELRRAARQPEARSYTIDTLRELRAELGPDVPLALLVGADSFLGLPGWKAWRELFAYAHIVVADRPGLGLDEGLPSELAEISALRWRTRVADLHEVAAGLLLRLHQPLHPASATSVRERIAAGQDWQALVPPAVAAFIARHCLYGMGGADDRPTL